MKDPTKPHRPRRRRSSSSDGTPARESSMRSSCRMMPFATSHCSAAVARSRERARRSSGSASSTRVDDAEPDPFERPSIAPSPRGARSPSAPRWSRSALSGEVAEVVPADRFELSKEESKGPASCGVLRDAASFVDSDARRQRTAQQRTTRGCAARQDRSRHARVALRRSSGARHAGHRRYRVWTVLLRWFLIDA